MRIDLWLGVAAVAASCSSMCVAGDPSTPGSLHAGRKDVTVTRPNGSTFIATLHYPATENGVNMPFDPSGGPYPIVSFGHGFLQPVTQYQSTLAHLATHGYFAVASQSGGGFGPSHAAFAADLRSCVDWLVGQNAVGAAYAGAVATDRIAFSGHSMGGGCAILAAKDDSRERVVVTLAAADTNPSSIAAASSVNSATRLIVGSQDTIVPPASSALPMYANLPGPRQLASITGGFHCGFTDADFLFCDSGAISRAEQLTKTRALMTLQLDLHLKFDAIGAQSGWSEVWGPAAPAVVGVTLALDAGVMLTPTAPTASGPLGGSAAIALTATNLDAVLRSFEFLSDGATFAPSTTSLLAQNESAASDATVGIPANAVVGDQVVLSARSQLDGATRGYAIVTLNPIPPAEPADLNGDGHVDAADLAILLGAWGSRGPSDLDGDGTVNAADLGVLLGAWS
ncbi:MAG: hypothetical protein SGJ09_02515 [Phycisphaerae bacterium]|nr:hypothetical protein [Phycisphaerae bacterium]